MPGKPEQGNSRVAVSQGGNGGAPAKFWQRRSGRLGVIVIIGECHFGFGLGVHLFKQRFEIGQTLFNACDQCLEGIETRIEFGDLGIEILVELALAAVTTRSLAKRGAADFFVSGGCFYDRFFFFG